jgi:hypothetical protein
MEGSIRTPGTGNEQIVMETGPDPRGFLPRYIPALTPLFLAFVTLLATAALGDMTAGFPATIPTPMGNLVPGMGDLVEMLVLLTAPVGIFSLFVLIGWAIRSTEMWASSALALSLSSLGGIFLVTFFPVPSMSRIMDLLTSIAYLILPASVVAIIIVLAWTEKFRRSIRYTITYEGLISKGGIWGQQERVLPHHHIGKLVMDQGMMGRLLDTGTIIPVGAAQRGPGPADMREFSRNPLDCLYGVREPEKIMTVLDLLISESGGRVERQVPDPGKTSR